MTEQEKSIFEKAAELAAAEQEHTPQPLNMSIKPADYGIDLTDHSKEAEAKSDADKQDGVVVPEQPDHPFTPVQHPVNLQDPISDLRTHASDSMEGDFSVGKVEVTQAEKDLFVRAALHDSEMIYTVDVEGLDATIEVAIPTEAFTVAAANAVQEWGASGHLDPTSNVQWLLALQQMHVWYQVRSVNGVPTAWADVFADGLPRISALRKHLANVDLFEEIINMSPVRWRIMVNALAVAEYKYKLCLDSWRTRAFFEKADTA